MAVIFNRASNVAGSDAAFREAEELYQQTSNLEGTIEVAQQRGIASNERAKLDQAAAYLHNALDTARITGNMQQEIRAKLNLSTNAYLAGDSAIAERYAHEALETARANEMESLAIRGLITVGSAYSRKRDYAGAEKYYLDALALARSNNSSNLAARSLLLLASIHDQLNRSDDAAREAQEALVFYQPNRFIQESFNCLTILGRCQRNRGDYAGALGSFQRLLEMADKAADRAQMAFAHESQGSVFFALEEYPKALEQYKEDLDWNTNQEKSGYAALQYANALWMLGRYPEAEAVFAKAEASAAKFQAMALNLTIDRAEMAFTRNRYPEAAKLAARALATESRPAMVAELKRLTGLIQIATGNKSLGLQNCEEALAASAGIQDVEDLLGAQLAVMRARLETGDRTGALGVFHDAEPALAKHPESNWLALALMSRVDRRYANDARSALDRLAVLWGSEAFHTYCARPDVQELSRPLLQSLSAKQ